MPTYEYMCPDCSSRFSLRRGISKRDNLAQCPHCAGFKGTRRISIPVVFSAAGPGQARVPVGPVSACSGCPATSCGSCGSR